VILTSSCFYHDVFEFLNFLLSQIAVQFSFTKLSLVRRFIYSQLLGADEGDVMLLMVNIMHVAVEGSFTCLFLLL